MELLFSFVLLVLILLFLIIRYVPPCALAILFSVLAIVIWLRLKLKDWQYGTPERLIGKTPNIRWAIQCAAMISSWYANQLVYEKRMAGKYSRQEMKRLTVSGYMQSLLNILRRLLLNSLSSNSRVSVWGSSSSSWTAEFLVSHVKESSLAKWVLPQKNRLTQRALDWRVRTAFSSIFCGANQFR